MGFDYNEYGDWFSEACVIPHFWHIIHGGYYLRHSNPKGHFNPYVYTSIETIASHLDCLGKTPHDGNAGLAVLAATFTHTDEARSFTA